MMLGAGREKKEDVIDYQAGILLRKKIGDYASAREVLAVLFSNHPKKINELTVNKVLSAFKFCDSEPPKLSLVKAVVTKKGIQHI
jgi:pyrimidine-nucleoside phosphorylase